MVIFLFVPLVNVSLFLNGNIMSEKSLTQIKINLKDFAFVHCSDLKNDKGLDNYGKQEGSGRV